MSAYEAPRQWDPLSVKHAIDMELEFGESAPGATPNSTSVGPEALAREKARAACPVAMDAIIHLATYSENESMRFNAAKYLVDRVLGKVTDVPMDANTVDDTDPLTQLVQKATTNAN